MMTNPSDLSSFLQGIMDDTQYVLSELEQVRGQMGLPIERDLYWQPKTLQEIAPDMFKGD
jgi:hypothetical protein